MRSPYGHWHWHWHWRAGCSCIILGDEANEFPLPWPPELILCDPDGVVAPEVLTSGRLGC